MAAAAGLVEVTRGATVESRHAGSVAVVDADGAILLALGDVERPVFARSAVKAIQALPMVESGAAEAYGFGARELALACASHAGEPEHVAVAAGALARLGLDQAALQCGTHWPLNDAAARALAASGAGPGALHHQCSGNHCGYLCLACRLGAETESYLSPEHPAQRAVTAAIGEVTGARMDEAPLGVDGCGAPTLAVPLAAIALGFARMGTGRGFAPARAEAAKRLVEAAWSAPTLISGAGRFDTEAMQLLGRAAFVKGGAEGVHVAALPELGIGVALKIDDGATRASEVAMAALLARYLKPEGEAGERLRGRARRPLVNVAGTEVGMLRASEALEP